MIEYFLIPAIIETLTILGRTKYGPRIKHKDIFAKPIHIHHGYIGIILILINLSYPNYFLSLLGYSLLISDTFHHLIVLPLLVGRTEFP